jgi:Tfp pilus assembly protein PilV
MTRVDGRRRRLGFGALEVTAAVAILAFALPSIYELFVRATAAVQGGSRRAEAAALAAEGVEIVRMLRNKGWAANVVSLTNGATYYPMLAANTWTLAAADPGPVQGRYTRTVTASEVRRDAASNISAAGTIDPDTRLVSVTVSWSERGQTRTIQLQTYVTNFLKN